MVKNSSSLVVRIYISARYSMQESEVCNEKLSEVFVLVGAVTHGRRVSFGPTLALAVPVLNMDLASFAVLGHTTVTNTGATTLTGKLGVSPGTAITGQETITINTLPALTTGSSFVHKTDALAASEQLGLTAAITSLRNMGAGTTLSADLAGKTLAPGVYTVPYAVSNLTGALILDGGNNANALWVFQMTSSLITSSGSSVNVTGTGAGAGVYWNVRSDATINTNTSFQGNILALNSIFLKTGATIGCGRALASVGAVTMDENTIGGGCIGDIAGSYGLSGSGSIDTPPPVAPVPEPSTMILLVTGLAGLALAARRRVAR